MNITVWNEGRHEKSIPRVTQLYPGGLHAVIASFLKPVAEGSLIRTATLDEPECGLTQDVLDSTDVLLWWGHMAHDEVPDEIVERVYTRVMQGMGLIVLHSGHLSKIFCRLMGTTCRLRWRDDTYERMFCVMPSHPIAQGVPEHFELGVEETYAEFFDIPQPDELIFTSWFDSGETFRSGCTWHRGYGKIFYFQPGHETNPSFNHPTIQKIIQNACRWAAPVNTRQDFSCPQMVPSLEEIRASK